MTPSGNPAAPEPPDDLGPDLLAHVRDELDAARRREIDALLAGSAELRAERDGLEAALAAWTGATACEAPEPSRKVLDEILAAIASEAAERRARATEIAHESVPGNLASVTDTHGHAADAVAFALGQLAAPEREHVERRLAADPLLADEVRVTHLLAGATRRALAVEPRPETLPALLAEVAERGPAPVHFDAHDVPAPTHAAPRRLRVLRWLAPIAAAAVIVIALQPRAPRGARVREGTAFIRARDDGSGARKNGEWIDADRGAFDFAYGDVLRSGAGEFAVRVSCGENGDAPAANGPLPSGAAEFMLDPGAQLARVDAAHFELLSGRMRVTAEDLADRLEVRSGVLFAAVTGTRFVASAVDGRLFVIVERGTVRLGRRGPRAAAISVATGEQGMVDAERVVSGPLDGRSNGDAFLTPRALLSGPDAPIAARATLRLRASLVVGDGGPVTVAGFDASVPLFLVRLKGPEGREHEVKIQESMLTAPAPVDAGVGAPGGGAWRLTGERPYTLDLSLDGLDLEPGSWEARLRYMSYRARSGISPWLGAVESAPVRFEVIAR